MTVNEEEIVTEAREIADHVTTDPLGCHRPQQTACLATHPASVARFETIFHYIVLGGHHFHISTYKHITQARIIFI